MSTPLTMCTPPPPPTHHHPHTDEHRWVAGFEKPNTDPSAFIRPATTVLSPYLKFGCLSARTFHARSVGRSLRWPVGLRWFATVG